MVLVLAAWAIPIASMAELYQWVDEQGSVQFSNRPPDDGNTDYDGPKPPTVGSTLDEQRRALTAERRQAALDNAQLASETTDGGSGEQGDTATTAAASEPEPQIQQKYTCAQARQFLASYSKRDKNLFKPTDKGFVRMTDADFEPLIAEWQQATTTLCALEQTAANVDGEPVEPELGASDDDLFAEEDGFDEFESDETDAFAELDADESDEFAELEEDEPVDDEDAFAEFDDASDDQLEAEAAAEDALFFADDAFADEDDLTDEFEDDIADELADEIGDDG